MSGMPPPMRVIPVTPSYAYPIAHAARPGMVTAVGVISIIVAILQMISAIGWLGFAFVSTINAQYQRQQQAAMNVAAYAVAQDDEQSPKGMPESLARIAVQGLVRRHALSDTRQTHVRTLMMRQGRELLPFADGTIALTPQRVSAQVSDCGPMGASADFYEIGQGRLEVTDQQAVFRRTDGNVFRSTDAVVDRALTEAQITQAITQTAWVIDGEPSPAQWEALRVKLRDPTQKILSPGEMPSGGGLLSDSTLWIVTSRGQVRVTPSGEVLELGPSAPVPGFNPVSGRKISTFWAGMTMLDAVVTGLLAIPLLIAGILLLRGRPIGRRMHLWWSWVKLPIALIGATACGLAVAEWMGAMPSTGRPPPITASAWSTGIVMAVGGAVYPVIVLIVLSRQRVRKYFEGVM